MLPPVVNAITEVREAVALARRAGKSIGLVPTMGALHAGHASLIRAARAENDFVVVTIFINPTQFGPNEDLDRYPRQLDADRQLSGAVGADLIFAPDAQQIYPAGFCTWVEVSGLSDSLCGASRTGHFRGVTTVVLKLFNIVLADRAYFGQKDAQQVRIIHQMASDLNVPTLVRLVPTVREPDGLAMSSRNRYLDPIQRRNATALIRALEHVRQLVAGGERDVRKLEEAMTAAIAATPGARLDYAQIVDVGTLRPTERLEQSALAALAVWFGSTRLIDNAVLAPPAPPGQ